MSNGNRVGSAPPPPAVYLQHQNPVYATKKRRMTDINAYSNHEPSLVHLLPVLCSPMLSIHCFRKKNISWDHLIYIYMIRFSSLWSVCKFALFSSLSHRVCRFVAGGDRVKNIIMLPSRRKETQGFLGFMNFVGINFICCAASNTPILNKSIKRRLIHTWYV